VTVDRQAPTECDFFISYTQADRGWAEWIAWALEEDGYRVLVQAWDFLPGSNWMAQVQAALTLGQRMEPSNGRQL
jgi:hypothetical protein